MLAAHMMSSEMKKSDESNFKMGEARFREAKRGPELPSQPDISLLTLRDQTPGNSYDGQRREQQQIQE